MKRFLFALLVLAAATPALAQQAPQTLLGTGARSSLSIAPEVRLSWFDGEPTLLVGFEGAWTGNDVFSIGLAGYGLATRPYADGVAGSLQQRLEGGYGGLTLGATAFGSELVHLRGSVLLGAGGFAQVYRIRSGTDEDGEADFENVAKGTAVFVVEPTVGLEFNVTRSLRLSASGSYRFTSGSVLSAYSDAELGGPSVGIGLRFGRY